MAGASNTIFAKMTNQVFPRMPDFYSMIMKQSHLAVEAAAILDEYIQNGSKSRADRIAAMNEETTELREKNMGALKKSISTPIDREDIFRAFTSVDVIIPWADRIVSDMSSLEIQTDPYIADAVAQLRAAAESLNAGFQKLGSHPADADKDAEEVFKACAKVYKTCRDGVSKLFECKELMNELREHKENAETKAVSHILNIFKRREVYRLLHDAGKAMNQSGKVLHDIVVQVS